MNTDLPQRWTPLRPHHIQQKLARREARFRVVVAGRRSGKTEIVGKRMLILSAIKAGMSGKYNNYKYVVAAPTREQVKRIYWKDLKDLIPNKFLSRPPQESTLEIDFYVGAHVNISLKGMDNPNRMEGESYDGVVLDEYGNMKAELLEENVMPTLSERGGWCDLIGVPEGRNHYYDTYKKACACTNGIWKAYHWCSSDILPAHEIDIARSNMDEMLGVPISE